MCTSFKRASSELCNSVAMVVPADKATNNVIVVCKKYYLEVVLKEITATNTFEFADKGCESVVAEHLSFMANKNIVVVPEL